MEQNPIRIVVYYCRNLQLFQDGQQKDFARSRPGLKLVAIPCSGKVEAHHLLETLSGGAQGALVLACAQKACHYLEGSKRSHKRVEYARSWLQKLGIEPDRLEFIHFPPKNTIALDRLLKEFVLRLRSFEPLPSIAQIQTR
jgi:F420-non-reducing hydrogenase iron-sulfur subunit